MQLHSKGCDTWAARRHAERACLECARQCQWPCTVSRRLSQRCSSPSAALPQLDLCTLRRRQVDRGAIQGWATCTRRRAEWIGVAPVRLF